MELLESITTTILLLVFARLLFITYKKFRAGYFSVAMPAVAVMFVFLGVPIILDVLVGKPDYSNYAGFYQAMADPHAGIYYNLYITFVCLIFLRYIKKINRTREGLFTINSNDVIGKIYKRRYFLWLIMLLPLVAVMFAHNPADYLEYKAVLDNRSEQFKDTHVFVGKAALLSALAAAVLFYFLKKGKSSSVLPKYILYIFLVFVAFWVDGKRGIIVKYSFLLLISGWILGAIKPKKLVRRGLIILMFLVGFVYFYGKDFAASVAVSRDIYSSLRVNMGRDQTIKFTMYREYVINKPILEFRGQSFLFDALFFVPRAKWKEKPYPYAVYFVAAVLNYAPEPIGWSFTTCILEEMISNVGFIGMLFAPLFLLWICKVGDRTQNTILKFLAIIMVVFFLFTQLAAFMPVFLIFLFVYLRGRFQKKKRSFSGNGLNQMQETQFSNI